jgi:hypothetical protein
MAPARPTVTTPASETFFRAVSRFTPAYPTALAFYCSDGRFTDAVEELLRKLGHTRLDTLTLPGGPGLLNIWSATMTEHAVASNATHFLVEKHAIVRAVLLAHEGCGYYRSLFPVEAPARIRARQIEDLRAARTYLLDTNPGVAVDLFYANVASGFVEFERVEAPPLNAGAPADSD